jgi:hypothetical protein
LSLRIDTDHDAAVIRRFHSLDGDTGMRVSVYSLEVAAWSMIFDLRIGEHR